MPGLLRKLVRRLLLGGSRHVRRHPPPLRRVAPPRLPPDTKTLRGPAGHAPRQIRGRCYVIDGDTIVIGGTHIRLHGIDAPEMDQPYGRVAKHVMMDLCRGQVVTAEILEGESYGRLVARCLLPDGTDLSAALTERGLALDWAKFSGGAYRHLEPDGVRRTLWRVEARHRGKLRMPDA